MFSVKRVYYHSLRFRNEFIFASIFSAFIVLFFSSFYNKDSTNDFIKVLHKVGVFGNIPLDAAGWSVWMSILIGLMMYMIIAVVSINIGSRVIPTKEEDGSEFFMGSNPMSPRIFYLENVFAAVLVVFIMLIPTYIVIVIMSLINNAAEVVGKITFTFLAFIVLAYFFISFTSAVTGTLFQRGLARGVGFAYVFYSFIMEIFASDNNLKDVAQLSVNYYTSITSILTTDDYNWSPIGNIIMISILFTVIGFWKVKSPHYIEKAMSRERFSIVEATTGYFVKPDSFFSKKFPLISEQLRKDQKALFIMIVIFTIYFPVLLGSFNSVGDDLVTLLAVFDSQSTRMVLQGNELEQSILGYGIMKFYANAWMWFGIYTMLVAANIPNREVRTNSVDIVFATNVKPEKIVDHRVIAMLIHFTIIIWYGFFLMTSITTSFGPEFIENYATNEIQFNYFMVTWLHYSAVFILVVAVSMIPRDIARGRRYGIVFFTISLLLNLFAYSDEKIEFIKYLSVFNYYDPIPILYGEISLIAGLIKSSITLILSILFYFAVREYRYKKSNLY